MRARLKYLRWIWELFQVIDFLIYLRFILDESGILPLIEKIPQLWNSFLR